MIECQELARFWLFLRARVLLVLLGEFEQKRKKKKTHDVVNYSEDQQSRQILLRTKDLDL